MFLTFQPASNITQREFNSKALLIHKWVYVYVRCIRQKMKKKKKKKIPGLFEKRDPIHSIWPGCRVEFHSIDSPPPPILSSLHLSTSSDRNFLDVAEQIARPFKKKHTHYAFDAHSIRHFKINKIILLSVNHLTVQVQKHVRWSRIYLSLRHLSFPTNVSYPWNFNSKNII